jgi:hypothetical protein
VLHGSSCGAWRVSILGVCVDEQTAAAATGSRGGTDVMIPLDVV